MNEVSNQDLQKFLRVSGYFAPILILLLTALHSIRQDAPRPLALVSAVQNRHSPCYIFELTLSLFFGSLINALLSS